MSLVGQNENRSLAVVCQLPPGADVKAPPGPPRWQSRFIDIDQRAPEARVAIIQNRCRSKVAVPDLNPRGLDRQRK